MALTSAGVAAGLWMELRAERAVNADLSERLKVAPATLIVAPVPVASTPPEPAVIAPVVATAAPASDQAPADPSSRLTRMPQADWQARQRQLMSDPRYREAFREQERLRLSTRRENFIRLLGLSPEQADAVIDLSIERQMDMQIPHGPSTAEEIQQRNERRGAEKLEYQAKLRDLLGEGKSTQLQTYMESVQSRIQVDRLRTQLTGGDMLRDDQVEPLIAALHSEQAQMQKEMEEYRQSLSWEGDVTASARQVGERRSELMKAANQRMHSTASGILSNSQLERLDAMLKRDLERHEAQQRMSRIQSKLDPPSALPTAPN